MSGATVQLPVATVQRALTVAHQRYQTARVPSPGTVDGLWGERSAAAYDAWIAATRIPAALARYNPLVDMSSGRRADYLELSESVASELTALARSYRAPTSTTSTPTAPTSTPGTQVAPAPRTLPWTAIGIGLATLGVVGVGFYLVTRKRRRRR